MTTKRAKRRTGIRKEPEGVVPEPWRVHEGVFANRGRLFIEANFNDGFKRWVAEIMAVCPGQKRPTADRIVACVNALEGIADPERAVTILRELASIGESLDQPEGTEDEVAESELAASLGRLGRRASALFKAGA